MFVILWGLFGGLFYGGKMKYFTLFLVAIFFTGCSTSEVSPELRYSPDKFYRRDLEFKINGKEYKGIAVISRQEKYDIKVKSWDSYEYVQLKTCHRFYSGEKEGYWWDFTFNPTDVELSSPSCPIGITAGDSKGHHGWALILMDNPIFTLPNKLQCNGKKYTATGSSACQSFVGLEQWVIFENPVKVKGIPGCILPTSEDGKIWKYKIQKDICQYTFYTDVENIALHVTIGFDETILKKN